MNFEQQSSGGGPLRVAPGSRKSVQQAILLTCSGLSGLMLFLALRGLLGGDDVSAWLKAGLFAIGGMVVSYGINKNAIDRGAPLAVIGYKIAGLASVLSIGLVGAGLFAATYAGLVIKDVEQLRLDAHGAALTEYVMQRAPDTAQTARVAPLLVSAASDLTQKSQCERSSSCVSGRPAGGRGPVARALESMAERAGSVAGQVAASVGATGDKTGQVGALLARYNAVAASSDTITDKRVKLQTIDAQLRQTLADRKDAAPLTLVAAFAAELQAPVMIPGNPDAARAVSAILQGHAQNLKTAVAAPATGETTAPSFPKATGVSETFFYLGHFAPIAAITAVVELLFPLVLWIYVALMHAWVLYQASPPQRPRPHEDDEAARRILSPPRSAARDDATAPDFYFRKNYPGRWPNGDGRSGEH